MTGAIRFQCRFWIGGSPHGPAHRCGETFAQLNKYVEHYRLHHDISRRRASVDAVRAQVRAEAQEKAEPQ